MERVEVNVQVTIDGKTAVDAIYASNNRHSVALDLEGFAEDVENFDGGDDAAGSAGDGPAVRGEPEDGDQREHAPVSGADAEAELVDQEGAEGG